MPDSNQNIVEFRLTGTLSTSGTTVNVSNDIYRDTAVAVTDASVTLINEQGTVFEFVKCTIASGVLTTSKRGITEDQTLTEDSSLKREWRPGTRGFVTSFASDIPDNENLQPQRLKIPVVANTTARDALYTTPTGGELVEVTSLGSATQKYNAVTVQWESFDIGTPTPNASTTVAGKVEIGTQVQIDAVTDIGETGALLAVIPSTLDAKVMKQASLVNSGITGEIKMWTTASPPTNWLICDGSAISRTTYASLFSIISTTYGAGNGTTTFNIPDFRGRSPLGSGTGTASGATAHSLGSTPTSGIGGEEKHVLDITEMPAHTHTLAYSTNTSGTVDSRPHGGFTATNSDTTSSTGGGLGHNIMSPHTVINFIIRI